MEAQRVHEYMVETGPNGLPVARLGRVHNLITFVAAGNQKIHYWDGRWVDDGKNPIDPNDVPQAYKDAVASIPFNPNRDQTPQVLIQCEFCNESPEGIPSGDYARHLAERHIRNGQLAVAPRTVLDPAQEPAPAKLRPEDLPPGNYVLDDEGFVVLKADGSPKKKAGRPRTEAVAE